MRDADQKKRQRPIVPEGKWLVVLPVEPHNSTVLGYPVRHSAAYWPNLLFEHAVFSDTNIAMAFVVGSYEKVRGMDPHLSVPFQHPDDEPEEDVNDLGWYRVRCLYEEGDHLGRSKVQAVSAQRSENGVWQWLLAMESHQ